MEHSAKLGRRKHLQAWRALFPTEGVEDCIVQRTLVNTEQGTRQRIWKKVTGGNHINRTQENVALVVPYPKLDCW